MERKIKLPSGTRHYRGWTITQLFGPDYFIKGEKIISDYEKYAYQAVDMEIMRRLIDRHEAKP